MKIVKQRDLKDCGVCCLQSIILFYNGYVSFEKLRLDTYTSKNGTSALHLVNAAKKYGFDSYGVKININELFSKDVVLPAIAHLTINNGIEHFVVIYKLSKSKITIMDPAKGKVVMKTKDFLKLWTNVLILFHPRQKILKYNKEKKLNSLFYSILKNQKALICKLSWISICLTMLSIISSYYFKIGLNAITNNFYLNTIIYIILLFSCITIFKIIFGYLRTYFENHLNKNIDVHIFSDFITHIFNLPLNIIQSRSVGEIVTRVNELNDLKTMFTEFFITIFLDSILAISSMILLVLISKELFFILCIAILLYILIGLIFNSINYKKIMQTIESETEFNTTLIENLNMFTSIKNLNTTQSNLTEIEKKLMFFIKNNFSLSKSLNRQLLLKSMVNEITLFLIYTIGFLLIKLETLQVADLITFTSLMGFLFEPIKSVVDMIPKFNFLKASYYKLNDFFGNNIEKIEETNELLLDNSIEFKNVEYTYNSYKYILKDVSFSISSKEHIFLKGDSGTGKSTICKLLYKLIESNHGNILIGGVSVSDYSLGLIRNSIMYVSQNEDIYTGTIRDNIICNRDINLSDFNKICEICKLESIVDKRPLRYESIITNDTINVSGGEKQRIILARALLKRSQILILDEALSEIDYKLESEIIKNIINYYNDKTIIYISHKNHSQLFDRTINLESINE